MERPTLLIRDDMKPGYYLMYGPGPHVGHFVSIERGGIDDAKPTRFRNAAAAKLAVKDSQIVVEVA